tara:strand:+ start:109 stop:1386 length:1278 start_codon:yes stop_codon:yes gene_type:complete
MNKIISDKFNLEDYVSLDHNDPLKEFSKRFHIPQSKYKKPFIYLSGNSLGLQPDNAQKYVQEELDAWKLLGVDGHLISKRPWLPYHEFLTAYSAEIVGALDKEVVVMNSLTVNLHLLMTSFYRPKAKRKKILIEKNAFPSDRYAVQSQLKFHGNDPDNDLLILNSENEDIITMNNVLDCLENHGDEIALVLLGGVNYYTGQAFDMEAITDKAQNFGCRVGFDLAHAAGNLKMKLHDWGVDFAAWCGYKYLNGGPGAPSTIFVHERHLEKIDIPRFEGWWGHDKGSRFDMPEKFIPLKTAEAWQLSNPPILSMAALLSSLEIFHEVGMLSLIKKSKKLTAYLESLLISQLNEKLKIITPKSNKSRGCQLSIRLKNRSDKIMEKLHDNGVICDWREPDVIRVAPVPLYNSFKDCHDFVFKLKETINA